MCRTVQVAEQTEHGQLSATPRREETHRKWKKNGRVFPVPLSGSGTCSTHGNWAKIIWRYIENG